MLSKSFNKEFFESVYRLNEGKCGAPNGHCGTDKAKCGGSRCGITESLERMNECGSSGCGGSWQNYSCEIGSYVRIVKEGVCGGGVIEIGRLLGYAD